MYYVLYGLRGIVVLILFSIASIFAGILTILDSGGDFGDLVDAIGDYTLPKDRKK